MPESNGNVKSIHVAITVDTQNGTGEAVADPGQIRLHAGDKVIWTVDGVDPDSHRPDVRLVSFRPEGADEASEPVPLFGEFLANGNLVESDGCRDLKGVHVYGIWLIPRQGFEGPEIKLRSEAADSTSGPVMVKEEPKPPDVELRSEAADSTSGPVMVKEEPKPPDVELRIETADSTSGPVMVREEPKPPDITVGDRAT